MDGATNMIGFIGQGWIGKNMANDFENRGYEIVRYSLEEKDERISECGIVFIAVPTPTTKDGFDLGAVRSALRLLTDGAVAVIKSTILPGSTRKLQAEFPNLVVTHSPEFLREKHAVEDTKNPKRNIVGITDPTHEDDAKLVLSVLPKSPSNKVVSAESAECIKYIGNNFLTTKLIFFNIMYDMVNGVGGNWEEVIDSVTEDDRIGKSHTTIVEDSGLGTIAGRGAGGHCFVKDFAAMIDLDVFSEEEMNVLKAIEALNVKLLTDSGKDLDILEGVYGNE